MPTQFALALLAAIGLVYLIMVATFRSLLKPLVLLVSIPFAATGAIIALVVTNTSLSLPGLIGILMLTGIVVTNAIVLLDLIEQYRDRGLALHDAIIEGGRHRLRPILMTAFATMLALLPLAVIGGGGGVGGAFISGPLAIVVIGGLFTSTVLTLVLVPVLYSLAARFASRRSTRDLDELLDAAEDRRFKPLGYRTGGQLAAAVAGEYAFNLTLEPEPGVPGDRNVLEVLTHNGLTVEPVAGTAKMKIGVRAVQATSPAEASAKAIERVRELVPETGYRLSEPEPANPDGEVASSWGAFCTGCYKRATFLIGRWSRPQTDDGAKISSNSPGPQDDLVRKRAPGSNPGVGSIRASVCITSRSNLAFR